MRERRGPLGGLKGRRGTCEAVMLQITELNRNACYVTSLTTVNWRNTMQFKVIDHN